MKNFGKTIGSMIGDLIGIAIISFFPTILVWFVITELGGDAQFLVAWAVCTLIIMLREIIAKRSYFLH